MNPFRSLQTKYQELLDDCIEVSCTNCGAATRLPAERVAKMWKEDEGRSILCEECTNCKHDAEVHRRRLRESDMPLSALDYEPKRSLQLDRGAYVWGPQGTGKTTYACHLLAAFIKGSERPGKFVSVAAFLLRARGFEAHEFVDSVSRTPILVLDDMDKPNFTEEAKAVLFEVIRHREERKLITIITANMSLNDLSKVVGPAIASRVNGMCRIVKIEGKDMRDNP